MNLITGICIRLGRKFTSIGYRRAKREFHAKNPGKFQRLHLEGYALCAINGDTIEFTPTGQTARFELHVTNIGTDSKGRYAEGWCRQCFEQPESL